MALKQRGGRSKRIVEKDWGKVIDGQAGMWSKLQHKTRQGGSRKQCDGVNAPYRHNN